MHKNRIVNGKYIGFHDKSNLPISKGDFVRIKEGVKYHSMKDGQYHISKKTYVVKVDHILTGCQWMENDEEVIQNPEVSWAGTGKYWNRADINDVEVV
jgi:hypothetical protein